MQKTITIAQCRNVVYCQSRQTEKPFLKSLKNRAFALNQCWVQMLCRHNAKHPISVKSVLTQSTKLV